MIQYYGNILKTDKIMWNDEYYDDYDYWDDYDYYKPKTIETPSKPTILYPIF